MQYFDFPPLGCGRVCDGHGKIYVEFFEKSNNKLRNSMFIFIHPYLRF